jgi:hypothetical protein
LREVSKPCEIGGVNGTSPDVEVLRPFNEAIELTRQILFRPFDLKKWFVIGFAAWLANLGGGGGSNFKSGYQQPNLSQNPAWQDATNMVHSTPGWVIALVVIFFALVVIGLILLFTWLRARGIFMFTDCIVRNRAAIAEPWREFRTLANSFFALTLIVTAVFLILAALFAVPFILASVGGGIRHHHLGMVTLAAVILWVCVIFLLGIAWMLIANLMTPIMYRRRCSASAAFRAAVGLISAYPGEITIYCLFSILLVIAVLVVSCLAACVTCCIAALPYIGTVILLPLYVFLRSFTLRYIRQFGNDYDVWASVPPAISAGIEPPPLQSPPPPPPVG